MNHSIGVIREFRTADFRVIVDAIECYDMDLSWDDDGEVLKKLNAGDYVCFTARARVIHKDLGEIACDYLGACIHDSIDDFQDHRECAAWARAERANGRENFVIGSYFSDMVWNVIQDARNVIHNTHNIYIRGAL